MGNKACEVQRRPSKTTSRSRIRACSHLPDSVSKHLEVHPATYQMVLVRCRTASFHIFEFREERFPAPFNTQLQEEEKEKRKGKEKGGKILRVTNPRRTKAPGVLAGLLLLRTVDHNSSFLFPNQSTISYQPPLPIGYWRPHLRPNSPLITRSSLLRNQR